MKFTTNSALLLKKLIVLNSVINSSNSIPILDCFLFEILEGNLKITTSDLETTLKTDLQVSDSVNGKAAVPASILVEMLKTLPDQSVDFSFEENAILKISSFSGDYNVAYQDAEAYPKDAEFKKDSKASISSKVLLTGISKTLFATGNDDLRPVMNGVLFELTKSQLNLVATDAHKLVKYSRHDVQSKIESQFIVPKKPLNVLKTVLSGPDEIVEITYNESNASFQIEKFTLLCRLVDGKYPNYEAVIPKENPNKLTIDRALFLSSVKRVSIFSNKATHQIKLSIIGDELTISAEDVDYSNKAKESLKCSFEGEKMQIGFNSRFLTEMLSNLQSNDVMIEMSLPNRAGILTPIDGLDTDESILNLVMPVMLKD